MNDAKLDRLAAADVKPDGVHYDPESGEWKIWYGGIHHCYAMTEERADQIYSAFLRVRNEHYQRTGDDWRDEWSETRTIPFNGALDPEDAPENTPDCHGVGRHGC